MSTVKKNTQQDNSKNSPKDIEYVRNILEVVFGKNFLTQKENFRALFFDSNEKDNQIFALSRIDPKKTTLLAFFKINQLKQIGHFAESNRLEKIIKNQRYVKKGDNIVLCFIDDYQSPLVVNSDILIFKCNDEQLESLYLTNEQKYLLRWYCKLFDIDEILKWLNPDSQSGQEMKLFLEIQCEKNGNGLYPELLKLPIKSRIDYKKSNADSFVKICRRLSRFLGENNENLSNRIARKNKEQLIENFRFLKIVKDSSEKNKMLMKKNEQKELDEAFKTYNDFLSIIENLSKEFMYWKNNKKDPLFLIKVLAESGFQFFSLLELNKLFQSLKSQFGDVLDQSTKKSVIELLNTVYESDKSKNKSKQKNEMASLIQICNIDENDLETLFDDSEKKQSIGKFIADMKDYIVEERVKVVKNKDAKWVKQKIDEYLESPQSIEKRYITAYIDRLKELNELDLVTIISLAKKGAIENKYVLEFAINNDIDIDELNKFVYDNPQQTQSILEDFSKVLDPIELADYFKKVRNSKANSKEHTKALQDFEKYAKLYQLYKIDINGKEIKKFLMEFKKKSISKSKRYTTTLPLTKDEVVYLYELGIIGGEYAFQLNENINILQYNSKEYGKESEKTRQSILLRVIKNGRLIPADAKKLFKDEIEKLFCENEIVTIEMFNNTLLGIMFSNLSEDEKISILISCDFSDELDMRIIDLSEKIIESQYKNTNNRFSNNRSKSKDEKKEYKIIKYKERINAISQLGIPDLVISINNGVLYAMSKTYNICILEQLFTSKKSKNSSQTGQHSTYIMTKEFYEEHKDEFCSIMNINGERYNIIDFSALFNLYLEYKEEDTIKRAQHKVQENNKNRIIEPWADAMRRKIYELCGIKEGNQKKFDRKDLVEQK